VQLALLQAIALALTDETIPFWQQVFELSRPRDQLTNLRRTYAVSALALLAIANASAPAEAALVAALGHPHEQVRALAAYYLAEVYAHTEQPLPPASKAALETRAITDPAFAPRFQARMAFALLERPVPLDPPETVYTLEVRYKYAYLNPNMTETYLPITPPEMASVAMPEPNRFFADELAGAAQAPIIIDLTTSPPELPTPQFGPR
jgi:hypothetical protein